MTTTVFVNGVSLTDAAWFNDVNNATYEGVGLAGLTVIASAATPDIFAATTSHVISYTGTVTSTGFATAVRAGESRELLCAGISTFTNGANYIVAGGDFTSVAGDRILCIAETTTKFRLYPIRASGAASMSSLTASLSGDVALNNTGTFIDGPSVAQGTSGTWFASGTVTLSDTAGSATYYAKLWDGTTVIASAVAQSINIGGSIDIALSGYLATPAGNLRISVKDITSASGKIIFNTSGTSKDATISAIRIA